MAWEVPQLNYSSVLFNPQDISSIGDSLVGALKQRRANRDEKQAGDILSQWGESQYGSAPERGSLGHRLLAVGQPEQTPGDPVNARINQGFDVAGQPPPAGGYAADLGLAPEQYRSAYADAGQKYGVDPTLLVRQGRQESGFDPNAVSPAGAQGISQFMPDTAKQYGIDPADPNQSIDAQGHMMADGEKQFGGNPGMALMAYNWGSGNVQKWLDSGADPANVPRETSDYVEKVSGKPVEAWLGGQAGGQPEAPTVSPQEAIGALPPRDILSAMLRNPITRQLGVQLVQDARKGILTPYDFQRVGNTLVKIDKRTGEVTPAFQGQATNKSGNTEDPGNVDQIAKAIANGDQPPVLTGLYRLGGPVRAALERQGYNLTQATQDWTATTKLLATMNGAQQTRLRQAVGQVKESLPLVQELADKWEAGRFPILNKANRILAKNGALGPEAQSIATQLEAEIADITSELGTVYKGGNSSTDESLKLAATQLSADWSPKQLKDAIALAQKNITYRENSLRLGTAGINNSQYNQTQSSQDINPPSDATDQAPDGVDPQDWQYLTPEERQQYLESQ